jgi:hypothetical protein
VLNGRINATSVEGMWVTHSFGIVDFLRAAFSTRGSNIAFFVCHCL